MSGARELATAADAARHDIAVRLFLADHDGTAAVDASGREIVPVVDAAALDIAALVAILIRPHADTRAVRTNAELYLRR